MGDEKILDIAKEISKNVYDDVIHPVAKPTGEILSLLPRAIKVALSPIEKWIIQKECNMAEIRRLLEEKLKNVSPDLIEVPEPYISVPSIQYISYCMDNDELRNMYANLLASSMQKGVKETVHPAYVEIIKQLCPDEAKILKYMLSYNMIPTVEIKFVFQNGESGKHLYGFNMVAKKAQCDFPHRGNQYFDNLIRLGLVKPSNHAWFLNQGQYNELLDDPEVKQCYDSWKNFPNLSKIDYIRGAYEITTLCDGFFNVCVYDP